MSATVPIGARNASLWASERLGLCFAAKKHIQPVQPSLLRNKVEDPRMVVVGNRDVEATISCPSDPKMYLYFDHDYRDNHVQVILVAKD